MITTLPRTPGQAEVPFLKMHGTRNHFVILDLREEPREIAIDDVQRICDVRAGVGAEQLLVIEPPTDLGRDGGAYAFLRIYQTNGEQVSACGNATRCIAHLLMREANTTHVLIETAAGILVCHSAANGEVSVRFGPINSHWTAIPLSHDMDTSFMAVENGPLANCAAVSVGNPHAVFFVEDLDAIDVPRLAPDLQHHPFFPEGANIGVGEVIGENAIRLLVWERPGMLTEACGTGACAAAYIARKRGLVKSNRVEVRLPGGRLVIDLADDKVIMTGPVEFCCSGFIVLPRP